MKFVCWRIGSANAILAWRNSKVVGVQLKTFHFIFFALLLSLISGCEKRTDEHGTKTMEEMMAADEALMCFHTLQGWVKREASGHIISCKKAAEMGDVSAQYSLGLISNKDDKSESAKWFRMAAEQGQRRSQLFLGIKYRDGEGVPKDLVSAYMWISMARDVVEYIPKKELSEIEKKKFLEVREPLRKTFAEIIDPIEEQMTASQIAEAKKLAEGCTVRKFKWC